MRGCWWFLNIFSIIFIGVGVIESTDPEGSIVRFQLAPEDEDFFEITTEDGRNGIIKTKQPLDREGDYTTKGPEQKNTYRFDWRIIWKVFM